MCIYLQKRPEFWFVYYESLFRALIIVLITDILKSSFRASILGFGFLMEGMVYDMEQVINMEEGIVFCV
jgi:hypothetical protein